MNDNNPPLNVYCKPAWHGTKSFAFISSSLQGGLYLLSSFGYFYSVRSDFPVDFTLSDAVGHILLIHGYSHRNHECAIVPGLCACYQLTDKILIKAESLKYYTSFINRFFLFLFFAASCILGRLCWPEDF